MSQLFYDLLRCLPSPASVLLLITFGVLTVHTESQVSTTAWTNAETNPVIHALCGKDIVLLGEPPVHGFGNTLEYKARLVRRLVSGCHFNAVFFESGVYDYVHIEHERRAGRDVSDAMISAAIGGF